MIRMAHGPVQARAIVTHIAYLLPFLSSQAEGAGGARKKSLGCAVLRGCQNRAGTTLPRRKINLVVDVYDTQSSDADFQKLMADPRLEKASLFVGPVRNSHLSTFAEWTKQRRKS